MPSCSSSPDFAAFTPIRTTPLTATSRTALLTVITVSNLPASISITEPASAAMIRASIERTSGAVEALARRTSGPDGRITSAKIAVPPRSASTLAAAKTSRERAGMNPFADSLRSLACATSSFCAQWKRVAARSAASCSVLRHSSNNSDRRNSGACSPPTSFRKMPIRRPFAICRTPIRRARQRARHKRFSRGLPAILSLYVPASYEASPIRVLAASAPCPAATRAPARWSGAISRG